MRLPSPAFLVTWCVLCTCVSALGETACTVAQPGAAGIQKAIDDCAAQGGGVAYVPPGVYVSGPFWIKDNVELRLAAGAVIRISRNGTDWPKGAGHW
jgi:polygalacturonase